MKKKIDFNKSVNELIEEYPELSEILLNIGFSEITDKNVMGSAGKLITIPKDAAVKNIPIYKVIDELENAGFEIENAEDYLEGNVDTSQMFSNNNMDRERIDLLKSYLKRLALNEDFDSVSADFVKNFKDVEASEIMEAEQELIKDGIPVTDLTKLCDLHSALFHGSTREEKIAKAEKAVEESTAESKAMQEREVKFKSFPKRDYSNKDEKASELEKIKGHPLYTLKEENEALLKLIAEYRKNWSDDILKVIRGISVHYAKKGGLIYPLLETGYGVNGPSDVMWTVDIEIRDELGKLASEKTKDDKWKENMDSVLKRAEEMVYKEQNILFPICAVNFTDEEWYGVYFDSKDYDECLGVKKETWLEAEEHFHLKDIKYNGEIVMPGGHLTVEQLTAMLNTIPVEITFIDADNINRYFNEGEKIFKRPGMALDRDVFSCHPKKSEPIVRKMLEDFRNGVKDSVQIWKDKGEKTMLVTYMAVRDRNNNYLGTAEFAQDMTFAKEHFKK